LLDILGKGGMGIVYKARHVPLNRIVAVKKIITGSDATDEQIVRFQREAEAAAHLSHPNIVSVYEVGRHNGMPFFSLEYVNGQALSERLRKSTMTGRDAADLLIPIAEAIDYSHKKGVLHRDLKPQNILLNEDGVPKVADFGLAKRLDDDEIEKTREGLILGTPGYMAPEQAKSGDQIGPHTDVYALGCILYYMMTGRPPFNAPTPFETVRQVLSNEPVPPSRLQDGLDPDLETICLKALEKDIGRRYQTAADLAAELRRYRNGEPIHARPITRVERVKKWCKRNPKLATLSGLAAALALIVMIGGPASAAVIYGQKQKVVEAKGRAEENAVRAEANAVTAQRFASQADAEKKVAEKHAEAAAVQEKNALDALRSMTFVVQQKMIGKTDLIDLRKTLLETVRNGLKRMDKNQNTARSQDMITAAIHVRLGDINMEIGDVAKAREEYGKCLAVFAELEQGEGGGIPQRLINWSKIHQLAGDACRAAGDYPEALEHHQRALAFRRQLVRDSPSADSETLLAISLGKLGSLSQVQGNLDAAREYMSEAVTLRERLQTQQPGQTLPRVEWFGAKLVLAKVLFQQLETDAAMALMKEASDGMSSVAENTSDDSRSQDDAMFHAELGVMQLYLGNVESAEENFQFATDVLKRLQQNEPNDLRIHQELEEALYGLSVAKEIQGEEADAQQLMEQVVTLRRQSLALDATNAASKIRLLLALARAGDVAAGVKLAEDLDKSLGDDQATRYDLACGYAQLADARTEAADNASDLPSRDTLTRRAVENLSAAMAGGFWRAGDLQMDPDLSPLRQSPAFQELLKKSTKSLDLAGTEAP
jgi:serine/threonine-protein kinase